MLGLESLESATIVISGIELAETTKKGDVRFGKLGGAGATMLEIWRAALAA